MYWVNLNGHMGEFVVESDRSTDCTAEIGRQCVDPRFTLLDFPIRHRKPVVLNDVIDILPVC